MQIKIKDVNKYYNGNIWALRDLNFEISPGILGLLGPNGAGKTTLMKILATVIQPSSGYVFLDDKNILENPNAIRSILGYLPQNFGVYNNLNAVEFLKYMAALKGLHVSEVKNIIKRLLDMVNLTEVARRPLGTYSNGMKQRIGIAQALLNNPQILIIDEPTVGLDPVERINFKNMLSALAGDRIILLSTHIVSDIESLATRVVILKKGQLVINSTPEYLLKKLEGNVWEVVVSAREVGFYQDRYTISTVTYTEVGIKIRIISDNFTDKKGRQVSPVLEDAYLYYTSSPEREIQNEIS